MNYEVINRLCLGPLWLGSQKPLVLPCYVNTAFWMVGINCSYEKSHTSLSPFPVHTIVRNIRDTSRTHSRLHLLDLVDHLRKIIRVVIIQISSSIVQKICGLASVEHCTMASSNGNGPVTARLCGEFTGHSSLYVVAGSNACIIMTSYILLLYHCDVLNWKKWNHFRGWNFGSLSSDLCNTNTYRLFHDDVIK